MPERPPTTIAATVVTPAAPEPIFVNTETTAVLLSLAPGTVGAMARAGELPSVKIRGRRLFSLERLREWARERSKGETA